MKLVIIIAIQPKYVELIVNGLKNLEIRKTFPHIDWSKYKEVEVYIYVTQDTKDFLCEVDDYEELNKEGLAPFRYYLTPKRESKYHKCLNGKVVAKFTLKKITGVKYLPQCSSSVVNYRPYESYVYEDITPSMNKTAHLSFEEIHKYLNGKDGYAWHIDELKILDKPLELTRFHKRGTQKKIDELWDKYYGDTKERVADSCIMAEESKILWDNEIKRAPQSWCYAEVEVNING